jgi:hypothetical protein
MKRNAILIALFVASFMFPSIGSINTADARGEYGCETKDLNGTLLCLRQKLDRTPWGMTQPAGTQGSKNYGCGNSNSVSSTNVRINCLRDLLDRHAPHLAKGAKSDATYDDRLMGAGASDFALQKKP